VVCTSKLALIDLTHEEWLLHTGLIEDVACELAVARLEIEQKHHYCICNRIPSLLHLATSEKWFGHEHEKQCQNCSVVVVAVLCWCLGYGTTAPSDFLPARRYASAGNSDHNVSVRPSVTRRYCVKTKKASDMIFSPSGSSKTLVFWRQISSPNSKGFPPPNGGLKQGSVGKNQRFSSFKRQYLENGSRYGQSYY